MNLTVLSDILNNITVLVLLVFSSNINENFDLLSETIVRKYLSAKRTLTKRYVIII